MARSTRKWSKRWRSWLAGSRVHGEAIYGTRPWLVYGEGAVRAKGGHFKEDFAYTAKDIRFTTKGDALYAIALGWPEDGQLVVKSLAEPAGKISKVSLLGYKGKLPWKQTSAGLEVQLPSEKLSKYTCALEIRGKALRPAPVAEETAAIPPTRTAILTSQRIPLNCMATRSKPRTEVARPTLGFGIRVTSGLHGS